MDSSSGWTGPADKRVAAPASVPLAPAELREDGETVTGVVQIAQKGADAIAQERDALEQKVRAKMAQLRDRVSQSGGIEIRRRRAGSRP